LFPEKEVGTPKKQGVMPLIKNYTLMEYMYTLETDRKQTCKKLQYSVKTENV